MVALELRKRRGLQRQVAEQKSIQKMAKSNQRVHHRSSSSPTSPNVGAKKPIFHCYYYYSLRTFLTCACCSFLVVFPGLTTCTFYTHGNKSLAEVVARNKIEESSRENDFDIDNFSSEHGFDKSKSTRLDLQYWAILDPRHLIQYEKKLEFTREFRLEMEGINPDESHVGSEFLPTLEYISTKQFSEFLLTYIVEALPRRHAEYVMEEKKKRDESVPTSSHHDLSISCLDQEGKLTHNHKSAKRCIYEPTYSIPLYHFTLSMHLIEYALPLTEREREEALTPNDWGWTRPVDGATATVHVKLWIPPSAGEEDTGKHILSKLIRKCNDVFQVHDSDYELTVRSPTDQLIPSSSSATVKETKDNYVESASVSVNKHFNSDESENSEETSIIIQHDEL